MLRTGILVTFLLVLLLPVGCSDGPTTPLGSGPPVREFWQGTYTGQTAAGPDHGSLVFDMVRSGTSVNGELVFRSRVSSDYGVLFMAGTGDAETLAVVPDTSRISYTFSAGLNASRSDTGLTGTIRYQPTGLVAEVDCREIPVAAITTELTVEPPDYVRGLATDGVHLWASTLSDFMLLDRQGMVQDRLTVQLQPDLYWTSDALTWDGWLLWGHLPGNRGSETYSVLIAFDGNGVVRHQVETPDRTSGLAAGNGELWSLAGGDLLRVTQADGVVVERVPVQLPDLKEIDYDGTDFWAVGWFLPRLYRIDRWGDVLMVADLPEAPGASYPAAVVRDGDSFWVCRNRTGLGSLLFRFHLTAAP